MSTVKITPEKLFDHAHKVAHAYGFTPAHEALEAQKKSKQAKITRYKEVDNRNLKHLGTLLHAIFEGGSRTTDEPLFVFHSNIDKDTKSVVSKSKKPDETYFTLSAFGLEQPYAEALVLSCVKRIFQSLDVKESLIRINSMGTREDSREYFTKFGKTARKMRGSLSPASKQFINENKLVEAHAELYKDSAEVTEHITPTLRLLSDGARLHFERVIEYLEAQNTPYELAPDLVEHTQYGTHTVFEVQAGKDSEAIHARGGRYDTLPYYTHRRHVPVISVTITLPEKTAGTYITKQKVKKPVALLIHAGDKARLRSLEVLSRLHCANVHVAHCLHQETVRAQLDNMGREYPLTIIFGQEEAENDSVCVRRADTHLTEKICLGTCTPSDIRKCLKG